MIRVRAAIVAVVLVIGGVVLSTKMRLRLETFVLWATGSIPDLRASDVRMLLRPGGQFDLRLLISSRDPNVALHIPHGDAADLPAGRQLFSQACAACHGPDARGRAGPALVGRPLRHGESDWALFRNITGGIAGTAMPAARLTRDESWRVIAYVRALQGAGQPGAERRVAVHLPTDMRAVLEAPGPDGQSWPTYSGSYSGQRFSPLADIAPPTIDRLRVEWLYQLPDEATVNETTPLVVGNVMLLTDPNGIVALDVDSGTEVWRYRRELPPGLKLCCGLINRGAAVWGARVYVGTPDARLIALDLGTGTPVWDVAVDDARHGMSVTGAPLAADGKIIVGIGGGDYGVRGHLDAYDPATGTLVWRFWTIPAPGDPAAATWPATALARGGGATWLTGSYDPTLRTLYWGVGNPGPAYNAAVRRGANLYTNSMVALDVGTGALTWAYQFSPNDSHDWDAAQIPVLVDRLGGRAAKLVLWANRNGFFYVLDRDHHRFARATPFARQSWNTGFDSAGHPIVRASSEAQPDGALVYPSDDGATNWWSPAFDPTHELLFVDVREGGDLFIREPKLERDDGMYTGGRSQPRPGEPRQYAVVAIDAVTGTIRWRAARESLTAPAMGGLLATAGGLVFGGQNDLFFALDALTGAPRWQMRLGGDLVAAPITFARPSGQRVAVVAGRTVVVFRLAPSEPPRERTR